MGIGAKKAIPFFVTAAAVFSVVLIKLSFYHFANFESPILLFFAAVSISAWYGGALQGLLASVLSLAMIDLVFVSSASLAPAAQSTWYLRFGLFMTDCTIITLICSRLRHSQRETHRALQELTEIERSLRKSEGQLSRIIESNMIGIVFSNFNGQILRANDYFLNLLCVSRQDLHQGSLNWKDFTPPELSDLSIEAASHLQKNEVLPSFEKEYMRRDGVRVPVIMGAARVGENSIVAYILDITERKQAERSLAEANERLEERVHLRTHELTEANLELSRLVQEAEDAAERLRQSESYLDSMLENIPNMIFVKEAKDLQFVRVNRAGEDLLGLSRRELLGKSDYDFFPKEQADFFTKKDRAVLRSNYMLEIPEEPIQTKGGIRYLHTRKIPILDKYGKPRFLLGISEDITQKKDAEAQRLELTKAQAERIEAEKSAARLAFLSEASAALNESLDIDSMLSSFAKVVIRNFAEVCLVDIYDDTHQSIDRVLSTKHSIRVNRANSLNGGARRSLSLTELEAVALVIRTGSVKVYQDFDESVLQKISLEREALGRNINLEDCTLMVIPLIYHGRVFGAMSFISTTSSTVYGNLEISIAQDLAKRASFAIENSKLYSKANEASRSKSAFLANISHEIRTPLGAMIGFAELSLDEKHSSAEQLKYLATIIRNGRQLLRIVDEVLDLSKVESDRIQIERVNFSLPKLIEDVNALLGVVASEKGIELTIHCGPDVPERVSTDPLRLRQILINVIGNAIKFTERGSVDVEVHCNLFAGTTQSAKLIFVVKDTGIGLTPEHVTKLFQPFAQADESMTRRFGGTGLGLFLSRKLARLLGGDVSLRQSSLGGGSEFVISVDVDVQSKDQSPADKTLSSAHHEKAPTPNQPLRVLVVDDSPDNRILISAYLNRMGIGNDVADNGTEGVQKAIQHSYDVVLMDIQMPELDGFEALKLLKAINYSGPVIALTAHAMNGDRERCLNAGFDDYLRKPLSRQTLGECLAKHMDFTPQETQKTPQQGQLSFEQK